ncbi:TetR/AcrR family transcriptional regulator [Gracilimonas amylolytica]|uniref:TetR/AcrR family transcriptional regulator n=1 Tax=Gracilimonas amylolytica TaxID=1749045 RepID=UPI000CD9B7D1|nr:TetR/AcrR family transcriptional regulator [Gracilimonas amylolytica]
MGIKERKEREKSRRRDQILDAAIELTGQQGFERTTMDEIAEKAELSKGTLYLYYKDKSSLYQAIKKRALQSLHQDFLTVLQQDKPGAMLVKEMISSFLDMIQKNVTFTKAIMLYRGSESSDSDQQSSIAEKCLNIENDVNMLMVKAIQIGVQDGSITTKLDPKLLALQIGFQMRGLLQFYILDNKNMGVKIFKEQKLTLGELMDQFLNIHLSHVEKP